MSTTMEVVPDVKDVLNSTNKTVDVQLKLAYPAIQSMFMPFEPSFKRQSDYLYLAAADSAVAAYADDDPSLDLEVEMIMKNAFVPIIQERERKFFTQEKPLQVIPRYRMDIYENTNIGNGDHVGMKGNGKRFGKALFGDERKEKKGFTVDDVDARFMGFDYYFKDEEGFLNGKMDDLPFWRGD